MFELVGIQYGIYTLKNQTPPHLHPDRDLGVCWARTLIANSCRRRSCYVDGSGSVFNNLIRRHRGSSLSVLEGFQIHYDVTKFILLIFPCASIGVRLYSRFIHLYTLVLLRICVTSSEKVLTQCPFAMGT